MTPRSHNKPAALLHLLALGVTASIACSERDDSVTIPLPKGADVVAQATAEATSLPGNDGNATRVASYKTVRSSGSSSSTILGSAAPTSEPTSAPTTEPTSEPTASASSAPSSEPPAPEPTTSASTAPSADPPAVPTTEPSTSAAVPPPSGPAAGELGAACTWNTDCESNKCWWRVCTSRSLGANCSFDTDCDSQSCGWDHKCRSRGLGSSCVFDKDCDSGSCNADVCAKKPAS